VTVRNLTLNKMPECVVFYFFEVLTHVYIGVIKVHTTEGSSSCLICLYMWF